MSDNTVKMKIRSARQVNKMKNWLDRRGSAFNAVKIKKGLYEVSMPYEPPMTEQKAREHLEFCAAQCPDS